MTAKKAANNTTQDLTKQIAEELLNLTGIEGSVEVSEDKENGFVNVQIETEQAGVLIGHRGETLSSLQTILRQIAFNRSGEAANILVNVGDWKSKREETLKNIAQTAVSKAKNTGVAQHIYDLTPAERRFVHIFLADEGEVVAESEGEGRERHLVIKLLQ
ncbi:MAG: KH domain-containing protein [Candidatus Blackburnbacteria bacterium]|nr:KH domain-containing protein [Candidatus Blackburnbacteria bacterium]